MASQTSMSVGYVLASVSAQAARPAFELQFSQLQNTVIRRLNDEIEKANAIPRTEERRLEGLLKEQTKLGEALPLVQKYREGLYSTQAILNRVREQIAELVEIIGLDDEVEPGEVEIFLETKNELKTTFDRIFVFEHEDVANGDVVRRVREEGRKLLDSAEPVVGTREDNRELLDSLLDLGDKVGVAQAVNSNNLYMAVNLEQDIQTELADIGADMTEVNVVQQAEKLKKIEDLKARYAQFLQAISLSFENNQQVVTSLADALAPRDAAKGTIVDLLS